YYRYQSGTPWQATGVDSQGNVLRYLEPAGSRRLPDWSNFDLLAAYDFRFGGGYNLRLEGRILNVFNSQAPLTVNQEEYLDPYVDGTPTATLGPQGTTRPNPLFGQYTSYSQPRRFVATLVFEFCRPNPLLVLSTRGPRRRASAPVPGGSPEGSQPGKMYFRAFAAASSSPRKSGCAMPMRAIVLCRMFLPHRSAAPYSVTTSWM